MKKNIWILFSALILIFSGCMRRSHYREIGLCCEYSKEGYIIGGNGHYMNYLPVYIYQEMENKEEADYMEIRDKTLAIYNIYGIEINKKQLDIESELLKKNPDWEKIRIISDEIGKLESDARMELLKINYDTTKKN